LNEHERKKTDPNKFFDMIGDHEANQFRINDKVLDAQQTKIFISINRLLTSSNCSIIYLICFICCGMMSIFSLLDIFMRLFTLYQVWVFIIEIVFMFIIVIDNIFKFLVMVKNNLKILN
jgi:hypothetical protein